MSIESFDTKIAQPDADDGEAPMRTREAIGPFADGPEAESLSPAGVAELLEKINTPRQPEEKIVVAKEREKVDKNLKQVTDLIAKEEAKVRDRELLSSARAGLGGASAEVDRVALKGLEEAKGKLETESEHIQLAEEYSDVFDSFSHLSHDDMEHIARTGKTKGNEALHHKNGEIIHTDMAKKLAGMHISGGGHITWGGLQGLKIAERIIHDITSTVKSVFGIKGGGKAESSTE